MDCVHHPGQDAPYQCYRCREFICPDCETKLDGRSYCRSCMANIHQRVVQQYAAETRNISYPLALLSGLGAALIIALLWSQVATWVNFSIPVWSALMGGAVGWAIVQGTGGKRGEKLQKMAAVIVLLGAFVGFFLCSFRTKAYVPLLEAKGFDPADYNALNGTLNTFTDYLRSEVGVFGWIFLLVGLAWAWYIPHERTAPE